MSLVTRGCNLKKVVVLCKKKLTSKVVVPYMHNSQNDAFVQFTKQSGDPLLLEKMLDLTH
jgi:hypothetical protein